MINLIKVVHSEFGSTFFSLYIYLQINLAVIYEQWLGKEQPILPRKFRPRKIAEEAVEDMEIRWIWH